MGAHDLLGHISHEEIEIETNRSRYIVYRWSTPLCVHEEPIQQGTTTVDNYTKEGALALFDFHESHAGVRSLVEFGITTVPQPFLMPTTSICSATMEAFVSLSVGLTLPCSYVVSLIWLLLGRQPSRRSPRLGPSTSSDWRRTRRTTLSRQPSLPPTTPYASRHGTPSMLPMCLSFHGTTCSFCNFGNGESHFDHIPAVRDRAREGDRRPKWLAWGPNNRTGQRRLKRR